VLHTLGRPFFGAPDAVPRPPVRKLPPKGPGRAEYWRIPPDNRLSKSVQEVSKEIETCWDSPLPPGTTPEDNR